METKDKIHDDGTLELWFGVDGYHPVCVKLLPEQLALLRTALGLGAVDAGPVQEPEAGKLPETVGGSTANLTDLGPEFLPTDFVAIPRAPTCAEPEPGDLVMARDSTMEDWVGPLVLASIRGRDNRFFLDTNDCCWGYVRHLTEDEIAMIKRI